MEEKSILMTPITSSPENVIKNTEKEQRELIPDLKIRINMKEQRELLQKREESSFTEIKDKESVSPTVVNNNSRSSVDEGSRKRKREKVERPRWYNQMNVVHMALKQFPNYTATRSELLDATVALDLKISNERGYPRVFTGKTPKNSASACLTNNHDSYFISFKDENSKYLQFKLAFKPGCLKSAIKEYNKWMKDLIFIDWPICFGVPLSPSKLSNLYFIVKVEVIEKESSSPNKRIKTELEKAIVHGPIQPIKENKIIPTSVTDIVEVKTSSIPNAGNGLFTKMFIPKQTPIGFYFGVPMTEDEYDIAKDKIGLSSDYAIMYRKTVLDATDKEGMPFTDPEGDIWCPFHFMNEDVEKGNVAFVEGAKVNQVICVVTRDVLPGEELLVYYGDEIDRNKWNHNSVA